jgi:hypothetical protein
MFIFCFTFLKVARKFAPPANLPGKGPAEEVDSQVFNNFHAIQSLLGLSSNAEVTKGVQHIIADKISKDKHACNLLKSM